MTTHSPEVGTGRIIAPDELDGLLQHAHDILESDLEQAAALAEEAIESARRHAMKRHEGRALHLRGWARFRVGDTVNALHDQLAALETLGTCADEEGMGRALMALGAIHGTIGDSAVALEHYEQALSIQTRIGDRWGEARTRNGLAVTVAEGEHFDEANEAFREVARTFDELGDRRWSRMADVNRCVTQLEQAQSGELSKAESEALLEATLSESAAIIAATGEIGPAGKTVELYARHVRAGALLEVGKPSAALDLVNETLPMATHAGDATVLVELEMYAATALEALGRPETVFERLDRAEQLAASSGRDRHLAQSFELRAKLCEGRGDLAGALAAHRRFHELYAGARQHTSKLRATVMRSLLDTQRAEHDLALATTRLQDLEAATQERKDMVSAIAHELRNPITSVLGLSTEMHLSWNDLGAEGRELMQMIRDEAEDLANIVDDLLTEASHERGRLRVSPEPCELEPVVSATLSRIPLDGKTASQTGTGAAIADPARVRQILRNLISNAVRYGGDHITVVIEQQASATVVEVRDTGDGIADEDRDVVFEPFGRGTGVVHGARSIGLGLAVTRELARLMNGDVTYGHTGTESVFRLTLPAVT